MGGKWAAHLRRTKSLGEEAARKAAFEELKDVSALRAIAELGRMIESRLAAGGA